MTNTTLELNHVKVENWKLSCHFCWAGREECKHMGQLYSCRWSWQNGMCLLALCVRKHTPRLLGGNIGVVGYTLQWAPRCCQNAHCSVALPRKLFLNAFLLTCSLHHNASECLLNVSAFGLKHFNMRYKLGRSFYLTWNLIGYRNWPCLFTYSAQEQCWLWAWQHKLAEMWLDKNSAVMHNQKDIVTWRKQTMQNNFIVIFIGKYGRRPAGSDGQLLIFHLWGFALWRCTLGYHSATYFMLKFVLVP